MITIYKQIPITGYLIFSKKSYKAKVKKQNTAFLSSHVNVVRILPHHTASPHNNITQNQHEKHNTFPHIPPIQ